MTSSPVPSILLAAALQQVFEICARIAESAPPEDRRHLQERLERLQRIRAEILDLVDEQR
ncbi:MAG: hypothetical protein ACE5EF_06385 [Dehalococcoidia bacterium]